MLKSRPPLRNVLRTHLMLQIRLYSDFPERRNSYLKKVNVMLKHSPTYDILPTKRDVDLFSVSLAQNNDMV